MTACLQAESREYLNPTGLRNLRASGRLPAVISGTRSDNEMIHLPTREFQRWLRLGVNGTLNIQLEGKDTIQVRVEELQRNPRTWELLHVDLRRV